MDDNIAPLKDRLTHCLLDDAYAIWKMVKAGERNINMSFVNKTAEIIAAIQKESLKWPEA